MNQSQRCWLAYEKNQLIAAGYGLNNLDRFGWQPVEYITGWANFYSRRFAVNEHVLIPRVESEHLVKLALDQIKTLQKNNSETQRVVVADVGTGSGAIGLSVFLESQRTTLATNIKLILSDISRDSLLVAADNCQQLVGKNYQSNIKLINSDLLQAYSQQQIDIIIANLPYIPSAFLSELPQSVTNFEPQLALDGGPDGLRLIRRLISQALSYLKDDGLLLLEVDERSEVNRKSLALPEDYSFIIMPDQFKRQRFLLVARSLSQLRDLADQA